VNLRYRIPDEKYGDDEVVRSVISWYTTLRNDVWGTTCDLGGPVFRFRS